MVILCRSRLHNSEEDQASVWLRSKELIASESPARPLEKTRLGGPQFTVSWLFPKIPAAPETLARSAQYGFVCVERRLNW